MCAKGAQPKAQSDKETQGINKKQNSKKTVGVKENNHQHEPAKQILEHTR